MSFRYNPEGCESFVREECECSSNVWVENYINTGGTNAGGYARSQGLSPGDSCGPGSALISARVFCPL